MAPENVILNKSNHIGVIRLNRPKAFNALNFGLGDDLVRVLEACTDDPETKAVIITGEGKAFCAGGDLAMFKTSPDTSDTLRQIIKRLNTCVMLIRRMPKPVVAAINGVTGGAGMSIAAACDIRICARSVTFKQAYTSVGLVPDGAWTLLVPLLIGFGKASEMAFLDPVFNADTALEMGLVNSIVDDGELQNAAFDTAAKLAAGPTIAYSIIKENLNSAMLAFLERQLELERRGMTDVGKTSDAEEGISAFLEKRPPIFRGI